MTVRRFMPNTAYSILQTYLKFIFVLIARLGLTSFVPSVQTW